MKKKTFVQERNGDLLPDEGLLVYYFARNLPCIRREAPGGGSRRCEGTEQLHYFFFFGRFSALSSSARRSIICFFKNTSKASSQINPKSWSDSAFSGSALPSAPEGNVSFAFSNFSFTSYFNRSICPCSIEKTFV